MPKRKKNKLTSVKSKAQRQKNPVFLKPVRPSLPRRAKQMDAAPLIGGGLYQSHHLSLSQLAKPISGKAEGKSAATVRMRRARNAYKTHFIQDIKAKKNLLSNFDKANKTNKDFVLANHNANNMPTSVMFMPHPNDHGREITPESQDRLVNDDRSHTVTQSLMVDPSQANKTNLMISENYIGNQVVFANMENQATQLSKNNPGNFMVHRQMEYGTNNRPTKVTSTLLKRSNSHNNIEVLGSFSHSNENVGRK